VHSIFHQVDKDNNQTLDWNSGEIRNFIQTLLTMKNLPFPYWDDTNMYKLYRQFDKNNDYKLNKHEARNLAHALFYGIVYHSGVQVDLDLKCPACGNIYLPDAKFCRRCGRKRRAEPTVVITDPIPYKRPRIEPVVYTPDVITVRSDENIALSEEMKRFFQRMRVNVQERVVDIPHIHEESITVEVPEYHHHEVIREVPKIETRVVEQHVPVNELTIEEELKLIPEWRREVIDKNVVQRRIRERAVPEIRRRVEEEEKIVEVPVRVPMLTVDRLVENHTVEVRPRVQYVNLEPKVVRDEKIVETPHVVEEPKVVLVPKPRTETRIKEVVVPNIERVDRVTVVEEEEIRDKIVEIDQLDTTERIRYIPRLEVGDELAMGFEHFKTGTVEVFQPGAKENLVEARSRMARLAKQKRDLQVQLDLRLKQIHDLQAQTGHGYVVQQPAILYTLDPYVVYTVPGSALKINITFDDFAYIFTPILHIYDQHITVLHSWLTQSSFDADVHSIFHQVDKDRNGTLDWNSGEIRNFIKALLAWKGLPYFGERDIYNLYRQFDRDLNNKLDMHEARNLAHALFHGIVYFGKKRKGYSAVV